MKVKYLAHACFLITVEDGIRIITDPYHTSEKLRYGEIEEAADIVTVSHDHSDHGNVAAVKGNPQVIKGAGSHKAKGIEFRGLATYHDTSRGGERGANTAFCFTIDGIRVCHLGDLGHELTEKEVAELGDVDFLLVPVGGFYTMDAAVASEVCDRIKPRVIIPMHFKTPKCELPIGGPEEFLKGKANVRRVGGSEVEFKKSELPEVTEIVVLQNAL